MNEIENKEEFSFDPDTHSYLIDGKPATGVTTIIGVLAKPALISWSARVCAEYIETEFTKWVQHKESVFDIKAVCEAGKTAHTKKKEAAGTHGTDTHALVEEYINLMLRGADIGEEEPRYTSIQPFIEWSRGNVDHFLFAERRMYNRKLFIAGTADFAYIGKDGKKYMADFKTSSGIYGVDYFLQVTAYRMLAEAEGDAPYDGMTIVRLGKDGKFEVQKLYEYETYKEAFLCCLTLYRAQAAIKELVIKE